MLETKKVNQPPVGASAGEVCIIEADTAIGELLVELLENQFLVKSFSTLKEFEVFFFSKERRLSPDLILCDAKLRDSSGLDALKLVRKFDPALPFILMVGHPDKNWIEEAFLAGATDLLEKPFESFFFIEKFRGRIAQSKQHRSQNKMHELLVNQLLLTTTKTNRLYDQLAKSTKVAPRKLRYACDDEDKIRFEHAPKSEEKLLQEIEKFRLEYLSLAVKAGIL